MYFYKLASSPLYNESVSEESRPRKAVLRYHQPTSSTSSSYSYGDMNAPPNGPLYNSDANGHTANHIAAPYGATARFLQQPQVAMMPAVVQSASTSPAMAIDVDCGHLPHFHDDVWARPPAAPVSRVSEHVSTQSSRECDSPIDTRHGYGYGYSTEQQQADTYPTQQTDHQMDYAPPHPAYSSPVDAMSSGSPYYHHRRQQHHPSAATRAAPVATPIPTQQQQQHDRVPVPSAPFANAGPPGVGVQFYPTPSQSSTYPPPPSHPYGYTYPYNPRQGGHASWVRMRTGVGCWSGCYLAFPDLGPFFFFLHAFLDTMWILRRGHLIVPSYVNILHYFFHSTETDSEPVVLFINLIHTKHTDTIHCYYYYHSAYILVQCFIPTSLAFSPSHYHFISSMQLIFFWVPFFRLPHWSPHLSTIWCLASFQPNHY